MFPRLFTIEGVFTLHTYGVLMAAALFGGLALAVRLAPRAKLEREFVWNTGVYMALAGLVGSKLFLVASEWRYYFEHPREIFSWTTFQAGGFFYGGLILGVAVGILVAWRERVNFWTFLDVCSPGVALGLVVARLGCFAAGCCWGKETGIPWAVTFTDAYSARLVGVPLNVPLHPTQLYEAAACAVILGALLWLYNRRAFPGQIFAALLLLYSAARFVLEFWRDDPRGEFFFHGALSLPQLVSIVLFLFGVALWAWQRRKPLAASHVG
jgi:phosphatidylglycerol:prolipoprotein diacylglycerol transferase